MHLFFQTLKILSLGLASIVAINNQIGGADDKPAVIPNESVDRRPVIAFFNYPIYWRGGDSRPSICQTNVKKAIQHVTQQQKEGVQCSIKVIMYSLDSLDIIEEINKAINKKVEVKLLLDQEQANKNITKIRDNARKENANSFAIKRHEAMEKMLVDLESKNGIKIGGKSYEPNVHNSYDNTKVIHEKFAFFTCKDKHENLQHQKVIVGSYNWTNAASQVNHENCLVINDTQTIQTFNDHFNDLWSMY